MRALAVILLAGLWAGSSHASGSISCAAGDGSGVRVDLTIGSLPVLAVAGGEIATPGTTRTLAGDGKDAIRIGQAFRDEERLSIDFTDPNVERVVARLRLVTTMEDDAFAMAGTLSVTGEGAWPLACSGP